VRRAFQAALTALLVGSLLVAGCERVPSGSGDGDRAGRADATRQPHGGARRLHAILEEYEDAYLALNPLVATAQGDHRFDDQFGDYVSQNWMADSLAAEQDALRRLAAIDPAKLSDEDRLSYEAFKYGREIAVEGFRYPSELLPLQQVSGRHLQFALLGSGRGFQPFRTTKNYDDFLARMDGFVRWVDATIASLRSGAEKGVVLPKLVVEPIIPQLDALATGDPRETSFWQPILSFPAGISVSDRRRLIDAWERKLRDDVLPAYRRLRDYLQNEYLAQARDSLDWSALPNGAAWYAYLIRLHTTTSLTPEEVHELGLKEVARLQGQMESAARKLGHSGELGGFLDRLRGDPAQHFADPEALLAAYRELEPRVDAAMPLLFARPDPARFQIQPVEAYRAASVPSVSYLPGAPDGTRPGVLYVNATELASRPRYAVEALYLHEAVPGHHYQNSLVQAATDLPRFRRTVSYTAYGEGWALYAESLGHDLGLYSDPYSAFGALAADAWQAARLVVDTGLHAKGWTRDQAVRYLRENTALGNADIAAEVERDVALPGEALGCKIGQLRITDLRNRAERAFGPQFDVRAFHTQILGSGSLPLSALEAKIDRWIAARD